MSGATSCRDRGACRVEGAEAGQQARPTPGASAKGVVTSGTARRALRHESDGRHMPRSRGLSGSAGDSLSRQCTERRSPEPCWCSSPSLRPTLPTGMPCEPRGPDGDPQAVASRPRSRKRRRCAPPRRGGRYRPAGHQTPRRNVPRSPASPSVRGGRRSQSPRRPHSGTNQGALFRITGNQLVAPYGPLEHPDHLIHS
jgi:hypothetical protein